MYSRVIIIQMDIGSCHCSEIADSIRKTYLKNGVGVETKKYTSTKRPGVEEN